MMQFLHSEMLYQHSYMDIQLSAHFFNGAFPAILWKLNVVGFFPAL